MGNNLDFDLLDCLLFHQSQHHSIECHHYQMHQFHQPIHHHLNQDNQQRHLRKMYLLCQDTNQNYLQCHHRLHQNFHRNHSGMHHIQTHLDYLRIHHHQNLPIVLDHQDGYLHNHMDVLSIHCFHHYIRHHLCQYILICPEYYFLFQMDNYLGCFRSLHHRIHHHLNQPIE